MKQGTYLYTIYRNRDDKLMILDGTAEQCWKLMGIKRQSFYKFSMTGGNGDWTILKKTRAEIEKETCE